MEYRQELLSRMIALYGLNTPLVKQFARMCEMYALTEDNDKALTWLVEAHEATPAILFE